MANLVIPSFTTFGELLKYLRRRARLTQRELAIAVDYSESQISRLEQNERLPDATTVLAVFVPALGLETEPETIAHLLALAKTARGQPTAVEEQPLPGLAPAPGYAAAIGTQTPAAGMLGRYGRLPVQPTPFLGRETELSQIAERLADPICRLLTLTGPGGIGKTRLALQTATLHGGVFEHGVYFVALAGLPSAELLAATILETFHLGQLSQANPEEQLCHYLHNKHLLLILDNFEHLQGGVPLLEQLLTAAPQLKLLVTSRERLQVRHEWLFPVAGLAVPVELVETPAQLVTFSAVQLFVQSAQRLTPTFTLTTQNAPAAVRISALMEGMPLGIELAAAWTRVMSCAEIADEIVRNLDFLSASWQDTPARHHSLRVVFEQSWRLLSPGEQNVLSQLAVFRSGFQREAAETVAGASWGLLASLVDKSWLRVSNGRFTMHELVRQFADEQLAAREISDAAQGRHSHYYGDFLQARETHLYGPAQHALLDEIVAEIDNIRTGWRWAVVNGSIDLIGNYLQSWHWVAEMRGWNHEMVATFGEVVTRLQAELARPAAEIATQRRSISLVLARALHCQARHCDALGLLDQAHQLCEASLKCLEEDLSSEQYATEHAYVQVTLGQVLHDQGKLTEAAEVCCTALAYFRRHDLQHGIGSALLLWSYSLCEQGHFAQAKRVLEECLAIMTALGEQATRSYALGMLGSLSLELGEYEQAWHYDQEAYRLRKLLGHRQGMAYSLLDLGSNATLMGRYAEAERYLREALAISEESGEKHAQIVALRYLGDLFDQQGDYQSARPVLEQSLALARQTGRRYDVAAALNRLGFVALHVQGYSQAQAAFREALPLLEATGSAGLLEAFIGLSEVWLQLGELAKAAQLLTFAHVHLSGAKVHHDRAEGLLTQLASDLSPEQLAAIHQAGLAMTRAEAITYALATV